MSFTISGHIVQINATEKAHSKCIVKALSSSLMIIIPVELLKDISVGDEVDIWGQLKGFEYNSKIYNNLFAKGVIKISNKFMLLKYIDGNNFNILKYSPSPINAEKKEPAIPGKENIRNGDFDLSNFFKIEKQQSMFIANAYSSHVQKALKENMLTIENEIIRLNDDTTYFTKDVHEAPFVFFVKQGIFFTTIESLIHKDL